MRISIVFFCLVLLGCGSSKPDPGNQDPANPNNLTGNWTGMLNSMNSAHSRTLDLFMTQNGNSLNSPRVALGVAQKPIFCALAGTMTGNVSNTQTTFNIVFPPNPPGPGEDLTLTGAVQNNGVSGNYTETAGCLKGESGTFQISPAPSITSSQWSGTWSGPFGTLGSASANLVEDSNTNITGTLTLGGNLNNNVCGGFGASPANITGSLAGLFTWDWVADTPGGHWMVSGNVDISGKALSLYHVCTDVEERVTEITLTHP